MTKAKTNALDALRTLIAERQQYEQWISALDSRREGTPEHVFERVRGDYQSRLEKVVTDIKGHAEELQLSISTLSSRLVEVAREEDTRREGLQEAELRAAVGEYQPEQWEQLRTDAERELTRIAADRASLDNQLTELRAIQKLSEVGSTAASASAAPVFESPPEPSRSEPPRSEAPAAPSKAAEAPSVPAQPKPEAEPPPEPAPNTRNASATSAISPRDAEPEPATKGEQPGLALDPIATAASAAAAATSRPRSGRTPPSGVPAAKGKSEAARPDSAKTLKCPECGTANYPTEWYCERCGGELATM
jgi:hypothetical protein